MHNLFRGPTGGMYSDKKLAKVLDRAMRRTDMLNSDIVGGIASIVGDFVDKVRDIGGYIVGEITGANAEKATQMRLANEEETRQLKKISNENYIRHIVENHGLFDNPGKHEDNRYSPGDLTDPDNPDTWRSGPNGNPGSNPNANPNANNGPPNSFGEYGRPDPYSGGGSAGISFATC